MNVLVLRSSKIWTNCPLLGTNLCQSMWKLVPSITMIIRVSNR